MKGSIESYDALVDLLESIEHFLNRLDIYTKVPPTDAMTELVVKIIVELLSTLALATKQVKEGKSSESVFGESFMFPDLMRHRKTGQEALWWREGHRGGTPTARPTHPGRVPDNHGTDFRGRLRPFPEYESCNGR